MSTQPTTLATADEVAAVLGIDRSTVYRLADRGQIPAYRFGRCRRFDLDAVLASGRLHVGGAQESPDERDQEGRTMVRQLPLQAPCDRGQHTIPPHDWSRDGEA